MKLPILALFLCGSSLYAQTTITSGTNPFGPLSSATDTFSISGGETTFSNSNNQGSGIVLDPSANGTNPFTGTAPTYFDFSSRVGGTFMEMFFGQVGSTPNSSDGINADTTAFSLRLSDAGVQIYSRGSVTDTFAPSTSLMIGDKLNFYVVVTPTIQNGNQYLFDYDVNIEVDATGEDFSLTGIRANQNGQSLASIEAYTFNAIGTRNDSGAAQDNVMGFVTISDSPIVIPEASASILAALGFVGLGFIRRRK
ncbi:hypothetical protein [Luteolibacter sp. AS25]|uniref:hypothetical protein n=1 Tax=Luteolibacter sp. AS25 TaxID=3135776 RepID=UPI00398B1924